MIQAPLVLGVPGAWTFTGSFPNNQLLNFEMSMPLYSMVNLVSSSGVNYVYCTADKGEPDLILFPHEAYASLLIYLVFPRSAERHWLRFPGQQSAKGSGRF